MKNVKVDLDTRRHDDPNFLRNEEFGSFLKITDCSQVSDGGAAIVLASEEGLAKLGKSLQTASS